ncbi:MAG: ABC transporter permease [Actinobacteria bacterium]|nr:ABC transporter permease [Actinomycetota bacterium]
MSHQASAAATTDVLDIGVDADRERRRAQLRTTEISTRPGAIQRIRDVWRYRELLVNLVRKELKVKYKNSILGFLWSLLNPALQLTVYSFAFGVLFKSGIPTFAIFFICGLLPWTFFTSGLSSGASSVVANAQLVNKVWFPREILPLAAIGAALVHWFLQSIVMVFALVIVMRAPDWAYLPLLIPAILVMVTFTAALGIMLSAINVYLRDTQHLLELVLLAWFWATPIVWPFPLMAAKIAQHGLPGNLVMLNPVTPVIVTFQRALYHEHVWDGTKMVHGVAMGGVVPAGSVWWYLRNLVIAGIGALVLLWIALRVFGRLEDDFSQEI